MPLQLDISTLKNVLIQKNLANMIASPSELAGLEKCVSLGSVLPGGITISTSIEVSLKGECPRLLRLSRSLFDEVGET